MSWLDILPSSERARIRKRLRSPEAYEKLREKVKGPEELAQEMEFNESVAEMKFALETEPVVHEVLRQSIEKDLQEQGIEQLLETGGIAPEKIQAIQEGNFDVRIESDDQGDTESMVLHPEGNVSEKVPLKPSFAEKYMGGLSS